MSARSKAAEICQKMKIIAGSSLCNESNTSINNPGVGKHLGQWADPTYDTANEKYNEGLEKQMTQAGQESCNGGGGKRVRL